MEAQLRRLWPRRKSLKKNTKPDAKAQPPLPSRSGFEYNDSYEATVYGPPPEVGTLPLKPSDNPRSKKSFGHSKAQSTGLRELPTVTDKDLHSRAKSTGGIKPVLIGISRPMTSESLEKDVLFASYVDGKPAAAQAPNRLNTAVSLPQQRTAQRFQPAVKRHVDIMSFAAANGKHLEAYNEEVASRNLDLKTLATESATTTSVPKSQKTRYQDDVATRNATSMGYRYKPSAPSQPLSDGYRPNSMDSLESLPALGASAFTTPAAYRHEGVSVPKETRSTQESLAYHSRNASASSKGSNLLPAIPQEFFVEDADRTIPWLDRPNHPEVAPRSENITEPEPESRFTRYPSMYSKNIVESSGQTTPLPSLPKLATRANQSRPIANSNQRESVPAVYSNPYEVPAAEHMGHTKRGFETRHERQTSGRTVSKPQQYSDENVFGRTGISSSRTSSADRGRPTSSFRHGEDMGNRTFMDLTREDQEKQNPYESPNTEYLESPVLAQATADLVQVHRAQLVASSRTQSQDVTTPSNTEEYGTSSKGLSALDQQSKRWSSAFSDTGSLRSEQPLAFSTVTTLSSMSPAPRTASKAGPVAERSRTGRSHGRASQSSTSRSAPSSNITKPNTSYEGKDQVHDHQQGQLAAQSPQLLYTSPESLNSGDFTNPSRAFGVLSRDFATTPVRPSSSRQQPSRQQPLTGVPGYTHQPGLSKQTSQPNIDQQKKYTPRRHLSYEQKSSGNASNTFDLPIIREPSRSPQLNHVDTPVKELTASSFDEEEFSRKQAQARAALLRLQMSLEEQYDMSPGRPDSSAQRHVARQILDQNRKPQPEETKKSAPPTSMYYEKKEYQSKAKSNRPAPIRTPSEDRNRPPSGYSYEKAGPNSFAQSVYSAVTVAPTTTRPAVNGHTKAASAGSASHSYNYANGPNINGGFRAHSNLPNPPLTPVLPSPAGTEVSLSSFPMPQSPENRGRRPAIENDRPRTARMHSTKSSVASIASVYSIPHHMVPTRDSSRRDAFDEEI